MRRGIFIISSQPESQDQSKQQVANSGKAVASLFLGLVSFCIPILPVIPAFIFGFAGLKEIARSKGKLKGRRQAIGGIVSAVLALVLYGFISVFWLFPSYKYQHEKFIQIKSGNNLHQIGMAMQSYFANHRVFPPAVVFDKKGTPLYSWRVLLLPYLEEQNLYSQFRLDEPWDSAHNKSLLAQMPRVYMPPSDREPKEPYATHYQVFTGGGAIFECTPNARILSPMEITDGSSKTLLVVEAVEPVLWSKPVDLPYSPEQPLPKLGLFSYGFNALFADGAVHMLPKETKEKDIRATITWKGGEFVRLPD